MTEQGRLDANEPLSARTPPQDLLAAVIQLSGNVVDLTDRLTVSDAITRRSRFLMLAVAFILAVVVIGGAYSQYQLGKAVSGNQASSIQACQNANQSRTASLSLWTTILGYVQANNDRPNPDLVKLQSWIGVLYQSHDCDDLEREYKIPPPPVLGGSR